MAKNNTQEHLDKSVSFWLCAGLLVVLVGSILSRDITRPFYGLHSWGQAHDAWVARSHVKYGLGYTKGFDTFAVGNPPAAKPDRYLDHPVLFTLISSFFMAIFGINTWALRIENILATAVALLLFLKILRQLLDNTTALLAGLLFALFPLIGYFGVNQWLYPLSFLAIWYYLVLIGALRDKPKPENWHKWALGACLFLGLQMTWEGFFFAMAIGIHYVFHCIHRKKYPDKTLLAILIIAPFFSLILDFAILAAGHGWDFQRIIELYKWRAGSGEMAEHDWGKWFATFWKHAATNFTLPILITAIVYLTFGQLLVFAASAFEKQGTKISRRFPQFWLFLMPPVFQLFILKGTLWPHQYWERPVVPFLAIATAQGVMLLSDTLKKVNWKLSFVCTIALVGVFSVSCVISTNHYYALRWQPRQKIEMFQSLNRDIPPDKALLSFEPFIIDQKSGVKQASYRPEMAWYLDRDIVVARTIEEIQQASKTGKYPFYLIPAVDKLQPLIKQLRERYDFQYIYGNPGERTRNGKFLKAGMMPYMIFDLRSQPGDN